jgi:hypothetical protein
VNNQSTLACYVSGKGMHATHRTRQFKVEVIDILESSGLGYDTRYRYYRTQFPEMDPGQLARMICDPIEDYDRDWADYLAAHAVGQHQDKVITAFVMARDARFRREPQAAIYCYDEAGFGSGVNTMRFILEGKPILGFYNPDSRQRGVNLYNVLQWQMEFPTRVTPVRYGSLPEIRPTLLAWLLDLSAGGWQNREA